MTRGVRTQRAADPGRLGDATLSLIMTRCLQKLRDSGKLVRLPGGFWVREGVGFSGRTPAEAWDGATTIEALVRRGLAEYTKHQRGAGGRPFPTEVQPKAAP